MAFKTQASRLRSLVAHRPHSTTSSSSSSVGTPTPEIPASAAAHRRSTPPAFSRANYGAFFQSAPRLGNQWLDDPILSWYWGQRAPASVVAEIELDLRTFGARVADDVLESHLECEANPPRLEQFDAWGRRVDKLVTCDAWKRMKRVSAEEGLVAIAYEKKYGEWSRLYQVRTKTTTTTTTAE